MTSPLPCGGCAVLMDKSLIKTFDVVLEPLFFFSDFTSVLDEFNCFGTRESDMRQARPIYPNSILRVMVRSACIRTLFAPPADMEEVLKFIT
ncbi:hypothetical protein RRG08_032895 [Elysia crispata]|uniref:Uncharacterized protein n=1 Tax=Elysia crispata TaxID=231223 RepID=A0AAE1A6Y5_9GAST|nr:hypothetical protein RRG08_032895 [Elysia crispata]